MSDLSATYFDGWYADMSASPAKDALVRRHLGLPPELLSTSLLGWDGIADVVAALRLAQGQTLLDLACGRGGFGPEIAARPRAPPGRGGFSPPGGAPAARPAPRARRGPALA